MNEIAHNNSEIEALTLTKAASDHILAYLQKEDMRKGLRLSVKKTGCSGLSYVIDYVLAPKDDDIVQIVDDGYMLCIDKDSYPYLKGLSIDYVRQGLNSKFMFINPNQKGQCGCGESFTVNEE